jgi:hypothetical protein
MTSTKRFASNRANAQRSTGPQSVDGKSRSSVNALKHGLAIQASAIPELAQDLIHLAQRIAGEDQTHPHVAAAAVRVAEASIDVLRVRGAKARLLQTLFADPSSFELPKPVEPILVRFKRLKVSQAARVRAYRDGTHEQLRELEMAQLMQDLWFDLEVSRIKQDRLNAVQLAKEQFAAWEQLAKIERYERRALSRRNTAIRAFDAARAVAQKNPPD